MLAPVTPTQIVFGEILYGMTKGFFGFSCVALVTFAFGVLPTSHLGAAFLVLSLISFLFASFGLLMVSFAKNYDSFTFSISGFIVPMSLFSGTYFPLSSLPDWAQNISWVLPLTHGVAAVRGLLLNSEGGPLLLHICVLLLVGLGAAFWAAKRITVKLEA